MLLIRTESSCLNAHLYAKSSVDSLTCRYGLVEDTSIYYLFQCQLFVTARTDLLDSSVPLLPTNIQCSTLLLVYGRTELTLKTKTLTFENVYTYIKSTKRFNY